MIRSRILPSQGWVGWLSLLTVSLTVGCHNAPVTGRPQFVAIPEQEEIRLGAEAWQQVLAEEPVSSPGELTQIVERVGRRLAAVSGRPDYAWEFKLLASSKVNAFALPGGKVAIYEGILPVCEHEAGLAVVMSHEIAHALARHGGERMSQQGAVKLTGGLLGKVTQPQSTASQDRWRNAYGLATRYGVLLPYSRQHETEADSIGLTLMAQAGYDPREAPRFWERFARASGSQPPEFLSTHPADARRAAHLSSLLPQALAMYEAAPDKVGLGSALPLTEVNLGTAGTAPAASAGITTAAFTEEFLAPITRPRFNGLGTSTDAVTPLISTLPPSQPLPTQPPPFPSTDLPGVDGWQSARP